MHYSINCAVGRDLYSYSVGGSSDNFFVCLCSMPLMTALDYHSLIMVVPPASAALVPE